MSGLEDGMEIEREVLEDSVEDIYDEIFNIPPKKAKLDNQVSLEQHQKLHTENQELKDRIIMLEKENANYARNISSLYATAKSEIEKKNFTIKTLSERLKNLVDMKSKLSKEEVQELISECQKALNDSQSQINEDEIMRTLKKASSSHNPAGRRKCVKYGNLSFYFFRDQIDFEREETVTFPDKKVSCDNKEGQEQQSAVSNPSNSDPIKIASGSETSSSRVLESNPNPVDSSRIPGEKANSQNSIILTNFHEGNCESDNKRRKSKEREPTKSDRDNNKHQNFPDTRRSSFDRNHSRRSSREYTPPSSDRQSVRKDNFNEDHSRSFSNRDRRDTEGARFERNRETSSHRNFNRYDYNTRSSSRSYANKPKWRHHNS